ncbi:hypothetical protein B0H16DRAFT_1596531 [Mycena metata]|uniref:Nephrocystin 3-like N-terminal domain-containing protein n=1 Tax=Mycena metata TaxID=1033252 RepID=A0AAD7HNC3_9AGAR|nr:hypothetical protein B0H16DRAFT_1596531 [Mycena metata]
MAFHDSPPPLTPTPRDEFRFRMSPNDYDDGLFLLHSAIAVGASHDSRERYPPPRCHQNTREVVFDIVLAWTANTLHGPRVLWVHGHPGSGKSAIAQTVAEYCARGGQLGATFFFSHGEGDLSDGRVFFPTIAYKLAGAIPELRAPLSRAIQSAPSLLGQPLEVQVKKLIVEPFRSASREFASPMLIVIDALDACNGPEMQHRILTLLAQLVIVHHLPLCFLLTSRPTPHLRATFDSPIFRKLTTRISLDNFTSNADVRHFLRNEFARIHHLHNPSMRGIPAPWPPEDVIELLVQKSGGQFLYAALVVKYVEDGAGNPDERLRKVVLAAVSSSSVSAGFTPTDQLYHHILSAHPDPAALLRILGPLVVLYAPLPERDLELLIGVSAGSVQGTLRGMQSLVDVPNPDPTRVSPHRVRIPQASTAEFLVDIHRALMFWVDRGRYHAIMVQGCIRYLLAMDGAEYINLSSYQYVRRKWIRHLVQATPSPELLDDLCELRFLYSRVPSEVRLVVAWLKGIPNLSHDVLDLWQSWDTQLHPEIPLYAP